MLKCNLKVQAHTTTQHFNYPPGNKTIS
uniref:Uncharacterized protein n=1 Tax=Anguilla anguilla TaxID=7936 RepID=A0A0E9PHS5_ANGAN